MQGLGLDESIMYSQMADLGGNEKVKVLLAQALFGDPDIILLDEPTNHLDLQAIEWLEDFLLDYEGTVIVVSTTDISLMLCVRISLILTIQRLRCCR